MDSSATSTPFGSTNLQQTPSTALPRVETIQVDQTSTAQWSTSGSIAAFQQTLTPKPPLAATAENSQQALKPSVGSIPFYVDKINNPTAEMNLQQWSNSRIVVAVHFGYMKTTVCWLYIDPDKISKRDIISTWPGAGQYPHSSIPTVLYYNDNQEVAGWGVDIHDALNSNGYPKPVSTMPSVVS
jgi:hypothetical protein